MEELEIQTEIEELEPITAPQSSSSFVDRKVRVLGCSSFME